MMIYTEVTPNPATLKFVAPDKLLLPRGSMDFPTVESAGESALARKLFEFQFVKSVMIGFNFVTVTREDGTMWEEIIPPVKALLKAFFESGQPAVDRQPEEILFEDQQEESMVVRQIKKLLDENIRPAVAMDGGDVSFESFEEGIVKLRMQGSCSGCPSSQMTLKMGIEGLLTRMIPEVKEVQAV
jgi:Fe-S cluster biogenesis protein NfuA